MTKLLKIVSLTLIWNTIGLASDNDLRDQIVAKERQELDTLKSGDYAEFAALLADEAVFVDAHGSAGKEEVVKQTSNVRLAEYSIDGVRFVPLSSTSGLITYTLSERGSSHGKDFSARVHVSALWTQRAGKWVCLFSQETAARQQAPGR
jgi:hypothetical protein